MAHRKLSQQKSKQIPDEQNDDHNEPDGLENSLIWDVGRVYYAYAGLLERVLVEQQLDHILRPGMGVVLFALYKKDEASIKELAEWDEFVGRLEPVETVQVSDSSSLLLFSSSCEA